MDFFTIILWSAGITVAITLFITLAGAGARKSLRTSARDWLDENQFKTYSVIFDTGDALGVDYDRRLVAISSAGLNKILKFDDVVSVEYSENGTTVSKTNRGSQALGAALGAATFGGVGAVIGGLSGSSQNQQTVSLSTINLVTADRDNPYVTVKVFESAPTPKDGIVYKQLSKDLMPWYGRLKAIIET
ncbi:hypothetical protein [Pararhizobium gei]|uniref:hypothetical protein n=1 Tax=Pararhizobium gei TaxID=1395951 RepID=UPI0023D9C39B|nr:hypothetical protein [Rhizobium gei]